MKLFQRYTLRSLRANRTRTLVTMIGIILSVALFTAVTEGAYSGQQYMIDVTEQQIGSFHASYSQMTAEDVKQLQQNNQVREVATMDLVGYAPIENENTYKPYLYVEAASSNLTDLVALKLESGRMPLTDDEIILPDSVLSTGGLDLKLGDTLTLELGSRTLDGQTLGQKELYTEDETFTASQTHTYTIVGIYQRLSYQLDSFDSPGYLALCGGQGSGVMTAYFTLDKPTETLTFLETAGFDAPYSTNDDLLTCYGTSGNTYLVRTLYSLMAILLVLILFGSVALIYNSFSISVSERTQQFGLLKSIGATRRQIRYTVLFEALCLCVISIPLGILIGCGGIGLTLYLLQDTFLNFMGSETTDVVIRLYPALWPLLLSAGIGLFTALISAWIPARRAMRQSPIEAIRQTSDVRIRSRQVKVSRLTGKLFGFSGTLAAKNFKRNRRKYRATVLSLFMSLVLFISASSFSLYLTNAAEGSLVLSGYDLSYSASLEDVSDPDRLITLLSQADGVEQAAYQNLDSMLISLDRDQLNQAYLNQYPLQPNATTTEIGVTVLYLQDDVFTDLLTENNLPADAYFDAEQPLALLYDYTQDRIYEEDGTRTVAYATLEEKTYPMELTATVPKKMDGYVCLGECYLENGTTVYQYQPEEIANGAQPSQDPSSENIELTTSEALQPFPVQIGAKLDEQPFFLSHGVYLIYPYSAMESMPAAWMRSSDNLTMTFTASDHRLAYESITKLLKQENLDTSALYDLAQSDESGRSMVTVVNVFSLGFIVLISLIAAANVFNTISTNISLRRRELAMLRSVGMTQRGLKRMMNYECLLYGLKSLLLGLPVALVISRLIFQAVRGVFGTAFLLPWVSIGAAVLSVFAVVFASMLYAMHKINKDNLIETLRCETQ